MRFCHHQIMIAGFVSSDAIWHPRTRISPHLSGDVRAIDQFKNKCFKSLTVNAKRERPAATAWGPVAKARFVGGGKGW
jgi:hypothetical protein